MDDDVLLKMYGMLQRVDERTERLPLLEKRIDELEGRVVAVEKTQVKHSLFSGVGAGILSFLANKLFTITLASVLFLGSGCGTLSASAAEMATTAATVKCQEIAEKKLGGFFENPKPLAEELCKELVEKAK